MRLARAIPALAISLAAAACATTASGTDAGPGTGTSQAPPSTTSPSKATPTTDTQPPVIGLLDFEYPLLGGGTLRGADLAGKDVAFWFWAPW